MHKMLRRFTIMAAVAVSTLLLSPFQSKSFAQDDDSEAQLVQPRLAQRAQRFLAQRLAVGIALGKAF